MIRMDGYFSESLALDFRRSWGSRQIDLPRLDEGCDGGGGLQAAAALAVHLGPVVLAGSARPCAVGARDDDSGTPPT